MRRSIKTVSVEAGCYGTLKDNLVISKLNADDFKMAFAVFLRFFCTV